MLSVTEPEPITELLHRQLPVAAQDPVLRPVHLDTIDIGRQPNAEGLFEKFAEIAGAVSEMGRNRLQIDHVQMLFNIFQNFTRHIAE